MNFDFSKMSPHKAYNFLNGLIAPRPIAWITSMDTEGHLNAAPFSAYNYVCTDPPIVAIGVQNRPGTSITPKDTAYNIRNTREFVINVVTEDVAEKMNLCAIDFPREVNELEIAGLTTAPSQLVAVPRIAECCACLECREYETIEIGKSRVVLGLVLGVYVRDEFIDPKGPYVLADAMHAVGRMNGQGAYVRTRDAFFNMKRLTYEDWQKKIETENP